MLRMLLFAAVLAALPLSAQSETIVIDKQARPANPTLSFSGVSGNASLSDSVRNSLALCGWFDMVKGGAADYVVSGTASMNTVSLRVANSAGKEVLSVSAHGTSPSDTAHAGVDRILQELFNIPGICRSRIVFTVETSRGNKELAVCDFDGGNVEQITRNGTISMDPVWSPDGKSIIYSFFGRSYTHLVQYDTTTKLSRRISKYPGINAGGALSPDGRTLALILNRDNRIDLFIRELEGTELRRVTNDKAVEASPCWSPDGKQLCFVSDASGRPLLYTVNPFGGKPQRIPALAGSERVAPDWSADNKLAYSAKIGRDYVIAVADMKSGRPTMEKSDGAAAQPTGEGPSWAPDNRHAAVSENGKIYIVDTWLGKKRALFQGKTRTAQPDWSPLSR